MMPAVKRTLNRHSVLQHDRECFFMSLLLLCMEVPYSLIGQNLHRWPAALRRIFRDKASYT